MSFAVDALAYDRFMGRYSAVLAPAFVDFAGLPVSAQVLDVGCGPGALTAELVRRVGAANVSAVEPSDSFVAAVRERFPGVTVRPAPAEHLPFEGATFDASFAHLVVHFMVDPVVGLREMARVTQSGGVVAACVWDHDGGGGPLSLFWEAVHQFDPAAQGEASLAGARQGHLAELFEAAGLRDIVSGELTIKVAYDNFEDWWEPFTLGVGPAGAYVVGLEPARCAQLRELCHGLLPSPPFAVSGRAWAARGTV